MTPRHYLRPILILVSFVTTACSGLTISEPGAPVSESMATIWDGVFSQEQAAEGVAQYELSCSACHSADLLGSSTSPSLVGSGFLFFWQDKPLSELFTTIQTRMPTDAPNSLPIRTYLNILSYILKANEFPAGGSDLLDPAALRQIIITAKS